MPLSLLHSRRVKQKSVCGLNTSGSGPQRIERARRRRPRQGILGWLVSAAHLLAELGLKGSTLGRAGGRTALLHQECGAGVSGEGVELRHQLPSQASQRCSGVVFKLGGAAEVPLY